MIHLAPLPGSPGFEGSIDKVLGRALTMATSLPIGVNVLRNDAMSALAIAAVTGAAMIRVNVFTGVMYTDQGPIGSGATPDNLDELHAVADTLIVGSYTKQDGIATDPVDPGRAEEMVEAARSCGLL